MRGLVRAAALGLSILMSAPVEARPLPAKATRILVQGHRGARAREPENTLPAFRYAVHAGVDVLELDLHATADDRLVVWHDAYLTPELVRGPAGELLTEPLLIRAYPLAALQGHELGLAGNPRFPGQARRPGTHLATFQDVLALAASSTRAVELNVELKSVPGRPDWAPEPEAFARLVVAELDRHPELRPRVIIQSFDHRTLRAVRRLDPALRLSALVEDTYLDLVAIARGLKAEWVSPNHLWIDKAAVEALHAAGVRVAAWTANTPAEWARLQALGVDAIITDDPAPLLEQLRR